MMQKQRIIYIGILLLGCILFILSIYDIVADHGLMQEILVVYGILICLVLLMIFRIQWKKMQKPIDDVVKEFEKTLKGKLQHFQCPQCHGIFAVKKSRQNNKKPFTLTCPDCGHVGRIPSKPLVISASIPEKKSVGVHFRCSNCGEAVSLWAEGTNLHDNIQVYSCPYCGKQQTMHHV